MRLLTLMIALLAFASLPKGEAQEPHFPSPEKEHRWLKQFNGQWTSSSKAEAYNGQPAMECSGSMDSTMLGGFWVVNQFKGDVGGVTWAE